MDRPRIATQEQSPYRAPIATASREIAVVPSPPPKRASVRVSSVLSTVGVSWALHVLVVGCLFWSERVGPPGSLVALALRSLRVGRGATLVSLLVFALWIAIAVRAQPRERGAAVVRARAIEGVSVACLLALVDWLPWSHAVVSELCAVGSLLILFAAGVWSSLRTRPSTFDS